MPKPDRVVDELLAGECDRCCDYATVTVTCSRGCEHRQCDTCAAVTRQQVAASLAEDAREYHYGYCTLDPLHRGDCAPRPANSPCRYCGNDPNAHNGPYCMQSPAQAADCPRSGAKGEGIQPVCATCGLDSGTPLGSIADAHRSSGDAQ